MFERDENDTEMRDLLDKTENSSRLPEPLNTFEATANEPLISPGNQHAKKQVLRIATQEYRNDSKDQMTYTPKQMTKYDFELDSAIMDAPPSILDATKFKVGEMSEVEAARFSYITSNLKTFNASYASSLRPESIQLKLQIEKIIAGDFDNESIFEEALRGYENSSIATNPFE